MPIWEERMESNTDFFSATDPLFSVRNKQVIASFKKTNEAKPGEWGEIRFA